MDILFRLSRFLCVRDAGRVPRYITVKDNHPNTRPVAEGRGSHPPVKDFQKITPTPPRENIHLHIVFIYATPGKNSFSFMTPTSSKDLYDTS